MTPAPNPLNGLHAAHATLQSLGVRHGLIGGWAVIAWGRVRATRDVDWIADIPMSRKREMLAGLASLGSVDWRTPGEDDPLAGLIRIVPEDEEKPLIDILLAAGPADRAAISRCVEIELGNGRIPTVRPEDIIAMKLQAGGGLDYEDARALLQIQDRRLDEKLLIDACAARRVLDRLALLRR
ncbi:MAG: hypothetical protein KGL74_06755 [Elusimicrobia bacterium]|nr:hypothetical protein [Elusimicrobiota bacterium]MDE2510804.1 hypothetical protein [Elusimicrobiota bacterium]